MSRSGILLLALLALPACARDASTTASTASTATGTPAQKSEPRENPPAIPVPAPIPSQPGEAGVREFVNTLMDLRMKGEEPQAQDFLSPAALEQFKRREGGLALTSMSFMGWELVSIEAADANSYEVRVRFKLEDETTEELLFVGPGEDASGAKRTWIVRGAAAQ